MRIESRQRSIQQDFFGVRRGDQVSLRQPLQGPHDIVRLWLLRRLQLVRSIFGFCVGVGAVGSRCLRIVGNGLQPHRAPILQRLLQVVPHQNGFPDLIEDALRRQRETLPVQILLLLPDKLLQQLQQLLMYRRSYTAFRNVYFVFAHSF